MKKRRQSRHSKLTFDSLEPRQLLAAIDIFAAGKAGTEQINLLVDNQVVASFNELGTGAYQSQFRTFSFETSNPVTAGDIKIEFVNDSYAPEFRDVQIDAIAIDGVRFETEAANVYSTGTWTASDGVIPGYRQSEYLHVNGYFQFADPITFQANAPDVFDRTVDPNVGTILTAFTDNDPQNPEDPWDILTNWTTAIDELVSIGMSEVTFAVYRNVQGGYFSGGPALSTVETAVAYANQQGLSVTMLPLFEAGGWRGDYNPTGQERTIFQSEYRQFISDLAHIPGIDRFSIGSELNAIVNSVDNHSFLKSLVTDVETAFDVVGNTSGIIGYTGNFDAYGNSQHSTFLTQSGLDYLGVSAYYSLIDADNADWVSGTGEVSEQVFQAMVERWTWELNTLSRFGSDNGLELFIQEFGAVQKNYSAVAPFAVNPENWVSSELPNLGEADPNEQAALYESLIHALDGRGDEFQSVVFWTWEHGSSRGERFYENVPESQPRYIESFAIWPTDGGGGEYLTGYLATANQVADGGANAEVLDGESGDSTGGTENGNRATDWDDNLTGDQWNNILDGLGGDDTISGWAGDDLLIGGAGQDRIDGGTGHDEILGGSHRDTIWGRAGDDSIDAGSGRDVVFGEDGNDTINGGWGDDQLDGGSGNDRLSGGAGRDSIQGGTGNDWIGAGDGNDHVVAGSFSDQVWGNQGDDTIWAGSGLDVVHGNEGNDSLFGEWGNDELYGGEGADRLNGGAGDDFLDGGDGIDTARFSGDSSGYSIARLANGQFLLRGTDGADTLVNLEWLEFDNGRVNLQTLFPQSDLRSAFLDSDLDESFVESESGSDLAAERMLEASELQLAGAQILDGNENSEEESSPWTQSSSNRLSSTDEFFSGV